MPRLIRPNRLILAAALALAAPTAAALIAPAPAAAQDLIYTGRFSNLAVGGFDAVAYFTEGAAVRGSREFETTHQGAVFRFSSAENLEMFLADPAAYAPQYGGYCAWAMAQGYTAKGDPEVWDIRDGKLYLNVNREVQTRWHADVDAFIAAADANYPAILQD